MIYDLIGLQGLKCNIVNFCSPFEVEKWWVFVRVLHPASFEKGIFKVCIFSLDDEYFGTFDSHGFFPGFHVSALLLFLLIVRWGWLWIFFLFDFFAFEVDGLELRRVGKVELFSVLILSLEIGNFDQFVPRLYRINDSLCLFASFFGDFIAIIYLNIAVLGQWVHEGISFETRMDDDQGIVAKVLGDFFPFNIVKEDKFCRRVGHILWLTWLETNLQSFLGRSFFFNLVCTVEFFYLLETVLIFSNGLSFIREFFCRGQIFPGNQFWCVRYLVWWGMTRLLLFFLLLSVFVHFILFEEPCLNVPITSLKGLVNLW